MSSNSTFGPQVTLSEANTPAPAPSDVEIIPPPKSTKGKLPPVERAIKDYLPPAVRAQLTANQQAILKQGQERRKHGAAGTTPMICKGLDCPLISYCDLHRANVMLPLDDPCPIEQYAVDQWRDSFLAALDIDEDTPMGIGARMIVDDLAVKLTIQARIAQDAAQDPRIQRQETIGFNLKGEPVEISKLNPGLDLLLRYEAAKMKILREYLGTPRAQSEAGRLEPKDPSTGAANAHKGATSVLPQAPRPRQLTVPAILPE